MYSTPYALLETTIIPTTEFVSVEECIDLHHINVPEEAEIKKMIVASRKIMEKQLGIQYGISTWKVCYDYFPCGKTPIYFPKSPVRTITSVEYFDTSGDLQEWEDYQLDSISMPARLAPDLGFNYPQYSRHKLNAVQITFTAGYDLDKIPEMAIKFIHYMVGHMYLNREAVADYQTYPVPMAAQYMLDNLSLGIYI